MLRLIHRLGAYSIYALYSGQIFVVCYDLENVFACIVLSFCVVLLFGFKTLGKGVLFVYVLIMTVFRDS